MRDRYFSTLPPKSCGREEFGAAFTKRLIAMCRDLGGNDADAVATATALTAESILDAYRRFVWAYVGVAAPMAKVEFCVAGGGARNGALMGMLRDGFTAIGVRVRLMEELGLPAQARGGRSFCAAGVADVEWPAGERSCSNGSTPPGGPRPGQQWVGDWR